MTLGQCSSEGARNVPCSLIPSLFRNPIDRCPEVHHLPVPRASGELSQEQLNLAAAANSPHCAHNRRAGRFNPFSPGSGDGSRAPSRSTAPAPRGSGTGHAQSPPASCSQGNLCTPSPGCSQSPPCRPPPRVHPGLLRSARPRFLAAPAPPPPAAGAAAAATPVQPPSRGGRRQPPRLSAQPELLGKAEMETRLPRAWTC